MARTLTQAYLDAGGYVRTNLRQSWSAKRLNPPGVALTVWEDETNCKQEPWISEPSRRKLPIWQHRFGNRERIDNILYGLERGGGHFDIVWITVRDLREEPRRVMERRFLHERIGILSAEQFDASTGMLRLELHKR